MLHCLVNADRLGVRRHHFRDLRRTRHAADGDDPIHDVALGENAYQFSIAQYRQSADAVFHHQTGGLEHGAVSFNGVHPAILHQIVNRRHRKLLQIGYLEAWYGKSPPLKTILAEGNETSVRFMAWRRLRSAWPRAWQRRPESSHAHTACPPTSCKAWWDRHRRSRSIPATWLPVRRS